MPKNDCKRYLHLLIVLSILLIVGSGFSQSHQSDNQILKQTSKDWGRIDLGNGYVLVNNVWNKKIVSEPYKQSIFNKIAKGKQVFGWEWSWPFCSDYVAYPEVIYGYKPWEEPKYPADLPVRVGSKNIIADFDIQVQADGIYNMNFDLWITSAFPGNSENITHEIIVQIDPFDAMPGRKEDIVTVNGVPFKIFQMFTSKQQGEYPGEASSGWNTIIFVAQKSMLKGPLQLSAFTDFLSDKGVLNKNLYITSVELGTSILKGTGMAEISDYKIRVE